MIFALILLGLAFAFIVMEVFIPSGGLLTVLAIGSLVVSVYLAFAESELAGALFLAAGIIGMPLLAYKMLGFFPKTRMGRRFLLFGPAGHEEIATSSELKLRQYEGKKGVTRTQLRPSGVAEISGERVNVVSEGMIIEPGVPVQVIEVTGNRVVVQKIEESDGREKDTSS